jgi:hypothetical protein
MAAPSSSVAVLSPPISLDSLMAIEFVPTLDGLFQ